jgi:hypothetical protein
VLIPKECRDSTFNARRALRHGRLRLLAREGDGWGQWAHTTLFKKPFSLPVSSVVSTFVPIFGLNSRKNVYWMYNSRLVLLFS